MNISTPLDYLGDVKEDLTRFPEFVRNLFIVFGYLSFILEIILIFAIPIFLRNISKLFLSRLILVMVLILSIYFIAVILLDPNLIN